MHIDYPQKRRLIDYFSQPARWHNTFESAFYADTARKGATRQAAPGVSRHVSADGQSTQLSHRSGAGLTFRRIGGELAVTDETGRMITLHGHAFEKMGLSGVQPGGDDPVVDVPGTDITVFFDTQGNKFLMRGGYTLPLPASGKAPEPVLPEGGDHFHMATITDDTARSWDIPPADLGDVTKMVIARDLGLECDLPARNIADHVVYTAETHIPGTDIPHLRPTQRVEFVEKPWTDTVQFEGHDIALSRTFFMHRDGEKLNIRASYDQREAILSQGHVLRAALAGDVPPIRTVTARSEAHHVIALLSRAATTRDHRGREWNYMVVHTKDAVDIAARIRYALRRDYGLTARDCAVLTFDAGLCVLAMASKVLDAAAARGQSLMAVRRAIEDAKLTP